MTALPDQDAATAYGSRLLRGERTLLRPATEHDLAAVETWWNDPEQAVLQQSTVLPRPVGRAAEALREWSTNASPGAVGFAVVELADGMLAGHATLFGGALPHRCATLAIILGPHAVGRGLGPDAVGALVDYGFDELGLHRIELRTAAFNTRAQAAYRRAGFTEEGRRRDAVFHAGAFHDEVLMAVLAHERGRG
ncbi:Protein N-acetyltransferase, RimJ/RimL family [Rathayibacter oskolensis]|uniref:Protein N-acetyltransferase, RimJ/RimL family n=1 Tax=Rathayibacter oskolensis TaxID=1891671 RepID=A0A1X7PH93_9MICO|nr:GNAT family protein [Rathayibacter oskolensis]SMH50910.1 Protein N-acetyltransferase, RimJ/RimL family [Rathayibacter oskolensis]